MNEHDLWIIALATLSVLFLAVSCVLAKRCISMCNDIQKLESDNAELKRSMKSLNAENSKHHRAVYVTPDAQRITALKLSLHLKNEEIEELKEKIRKQNVLLKQKWEGSKKCV